MQCIIATIYSRICIIANDLLNLNNFSKICENRFDYLLYFCYYIYGNNEGEYNENCC